MTKSLWVCLGTAAVCVAAATQSGSAQGASARPAAAAGQARRPATPATPAPSHQPAAAADHNAVVRRYCATCHSDARKSGGLSLAAFDVARAAEHAELAERVVRKLQAGLMPPPAAPRPDAAATTALITALET